MDYIKFYLSNPRIISFCFILTFFSSFGQTFLISLYVPGLMQSFHMSNSLFGTIYAAATVLASVFLVHFGRLIDRSDLRKYTVLTALILFFACMLLAFSFHIAMVFVGIFGLRLAGQGLLGHIAGTTAARSFEEQRGRALSLSTLGHSFGEGLFPILVSFVIIAIGWRGAMAASGFVSLLVLIPFVWFILKGWDDGREPEINCATEKPFSRVELLKTKNFYIIAFNSAVVPFVVTGLFFYQVILAGEKGWSLELIASAFTGFAVGRTVSVIISGKLIDRYSGMRLLPFYLLPMIAGLVILMVTDFPAAAFIYLLLTGFSVGSGNTIKNAALAEFYGTANLGSIRSLFITIIVFSTALSPVLFGVMLDQNLGFVVIIAGSIGLTVFAVLTSLGIAFRKQK